MNEFNYENLLKHFKFQLEFRKHQKIVLEKFEQIILKHKDTPFKFHVVSPPGSGKTIMGIEMGIRMGNPMLIICPNTTIQGQWLDKFNLLCLLRILN